MAEHSATSDPTSYPQPPEGDGVKSEERRRVDRGGVPVDLAKRLFELQALIDRKDDENRRLHARNQKVEEKNREQSMSLEEKDEQIIRLYEDVESLKGSEGRWKDKYEGLYEKCQRERDEYESVEAKWKEKAEMMEERCWRLENVEKRKLEMDLEASRRRAGEIGEEVERLKKAAEEREVVILEVRKRNEELERGKAKMETELGDRLVRLGAGVAKWGRLMSLWKPGKENKSGDEGGRAMDGLGCFVQGQKSIGVSVLDPKKENVEANVQFTCTPKPTDYHFVQISDDEEEEGQEKQMQASFASPSPAVAESPQTKRKLEAGTDSAKKQRPETKRCKLNGFKDGKVWKTALEMQKAFETDHLLCMKSVCALYRKHKSLGVWKYCLDGNKGFARGLEARGVALGKILTSGDPEGIMKKSVTDLEREDSKGIMNCRFIAKFHYKELFEIYKNNLDPSFLP